MKVGKIVLLWLMATMVHLSKTGITLQPINVTDFEPITYSNEDIEKLPVRILGVAIEIRRKV